MKLYEISESIRALMDQAEETGEIDNDALTALEIDFADKCESVAVVIREFEADAAGYKAEIDRMAERKRSAENRAESLKDYLRTHMEAMGETKVKGNLFSITLGKPSQVVTITGDVPEQYQAVKVTPDKTAIGRDLKAGKAIEGATLTQGKARISIK